jgi:phage terminase small subunit
VVEEYGLEEGMLPTLSGAAELWDRACEAREVIDEHGITYTDRFDQPKERPEVSIERNSKVAFARMVRELGLEPDGPSPDDARPPRIGKVRRK